jgi:hypothetical protein
MIVSGPWYFTNGDIWETEDNHPIDSAEQISVSESTSYSGYFYGSFAGTLDSTDDESDNFLFANSDVGGLEGLFLSVYVETAMHGSLLDAQVSVYADDDGTMTLLDTATIDPDGLSSDDPAIWDLELDSDDDIYIAVEHESGSEDADAARFYFAQAVVYTSAIN